jgi:NADH-quinone oxidoreductase subunit L
MTHPLTLNPTVAAALVTVLAPLAAFVTILVATRRRPRLSAGLSLGAIGICLLGTLFLLVRHWGAPTPLQFSGRWLVAGEIAVPFGFLIDPLSLLMLTVVASICLLVQVYSLGYMAGDPGFARYYAFMSLFAWAMTSMTLAPSLFQLYVFWELVGLASYLLIGFWFDKWRASEAGKKAFVMTRLGDVAFLLGLLLVLTQLGDLDIQALNAPETAARLSPGLITLSSLLIFGGIIGKSAQFPLLTWLPDAMEGPTPVSALLHSATMVAAGVFLFARLFPFFSLSPVAMAVFLTVGTLSMLLAATMAMVSRDIKQVFAYSTISQLGLMIMGLAAGGYFAGVFHLTTHAGFKALLFLCAGVFIHHCGSNDLFAIARAGGRRLKTAMVCMIIGAAALSGLPPLSGFFSKELILAALAARPTAVWLAAGMLGVFLTAYYTFRLIFIILFPSVNAPAPAEDQAAPAAHPSGDHDDPRRKRAMTLPLVALAAITVLLGLAQTPLAAFLQGPQALTPEPAGHHRALLFWAVGLTLAGLLLAWLEFGRPRSRQVGFVEKIPPLYLLFSQRWFLDRFYRQLLDRVLYRGLAGFCTWNDRRVIDDGIDGLARTAARAGGLLERAHSGMIQYRLMVIFVSMALLGFYFFL